MCRLPTATLLLFVCLPLFGEDLFPTLSAQHLNGNCYLVNVAGNNVIIADYAEGLVFVDGGEDVYANGSLSFIEQQFANKPINALFNTHWHKEQTGLNQLLGKRGTPIIAHHNTKHWLATRQYNVWLNTTIEPVSITALPTETFYDQFDLSLGNKNIVAGYLPLAHTDSDIYVYFPDDNVLAVGGVISTNRWPEIDWWSAGWFGGMLDGLETLLAIADDNTVIVPTHGKPISKKELQQQYDMYVVLFDRILTLLKASHSPAEAVAAKPTADFHPEWNNADAFVESAFRSFYGHLRGEKRMGLMP